MPGSNCSVRVLSLSYYFFYPTTNNRSLKNQILGYVLESELACTEDESTETDSFLPESPDGSASMTSVTMTTETLEGGWSVEKRVPSTSVQIV